MTATSKYVAAIVAASCTILTSAAAHAVTCDNLGSGFPGIEVNIGGSSAAKPLIKQISGTLATKGIRVVYWKLGSCAGLTDITTATNVTGTGAGTYWDESNSLNELACDAPSGGTPLDVAASDVYPSSCNNITLLGTQKDFHDTSPVQIFSFIVPPSSSKNVISEEAAQVVFGFGGATYAVTPWTDPLYIFKRDPTKSGSYSMLAKLLAFDASSKIKGTIPGAGDTQAIVDAVSASTQYDKTIGVVSEDYADLYRTSTTKQIKILAYQDKGAACGFYPDSSKSTYDKVNVRTGLYPFWGPLHFITSVDGAAKPTNAQVAALLSYFELTTVATADAGITLLEADKKTMIDNIVTAYTIPNCAMKVTRSSEVAPQTKPASYDPPEPCGCYYDYKVSGATSCTVCTNDGPCGSGKCRYGYCEAK